MGWEIFAAIAAISSVFGASESMAAGRRQKSAQALQRQAENLRFAKERRDTIRSARLSYAQAEQAAANQGVSTSSGAYGGQGSITSQMNSGLSFLDAQQGLGNKAGEYLDKAAQNQGKASMWGAVANLSLAAASFTTPPSWLTGKPPGSTAALPPGSYGPGKFAYTPNIPKMTFKF